MKSDLKVQKAHVLHGHSFNFNERIFRKRSDLNGTSGGELSMGKICGVDLIHGGKILYIVEKNCGFYNIVHS